jgi:hypothetical protein
MVVVSSPLWHVRGIFFSPARAVWNSPVWLILRKQRRDAQQFDFIGIDIFSTASREEIALLAIKTIKLDLAECLLFDSR